MGSLRNLFRSLSSKKLSKTPKNKERQTDDTRTSYDSWARRNGLARQSSFRSLQSKKVNRRASYPGPANKKVMLDLDVPKNKKLNIKPSRSASYPGPANKKSMLPLDVPKTSPANKKSMLPLDVPKNKKPILPLDVPKKQKPIFPKNPPRCSPSMSDSSRSSQSMSDSSSTASSRTQRRRRKPRSVALAGEIPTRPQFDPLEVMEYEIAERYNFQGLLAQETTKKSDTPVKPERQRSKRDFFQRQRSKRDMAKKAREREFLANEARRAERRLGRSMYSQAKTRKLLLASQEADPITVPRQMYTAAAFMATPTPKAAVPTNVNSTTRKLLLAAQEDTFLITNNKKAAQRSLHMRRGGLPAAALMAAPPKAE